MTRLLFVDACVHKDRSRTERLARELICRLPHDDVETVDLEHLGLRPLDTASLEWRDSAIASGDFSDARFDQARKLLSADTVVMASPYWEGMFNSSLKTYIENVSVPRMVYSYDEHGVPVGKCHGTLYYVTTRGGPVPDEGDFGFSALKYIGRLFGFSDVKCVSASALDIVGNDPGDILLKAVFSIDEVLGR